MKSLVNFVLKNKLAVWLLTIIILVFGAHSGTKMKTEMIPDISIPYLVVTNVYPGATPEQVMEEVSIPLEKTVENLKNVKTVYSNSYSNMASLQVEYDYGIDMDEANRKLEAALNGVKLPEDAGEVNITEISMDMMPVLSLSVSSTEEDIVELTSTVEDILLAKITKLDGVADVTVTGQHLEEIELTYDEEKLAEFDLTKETVKDMIEASNLAVSLGLYEFEGEEQALAVDGQFTSLDEFKDMLIPVTPSESNPAPFVKLKDLASVELKGKVESISRTNGQDAIAVQIVKGQEANTVEVVNSVKDLIKEEEDRIDGLTIDISLDQGEPIEDSVSTMVEKALFGGLIAVLIILLFLRDFKSTIISVISIPVSIFMALLLLNWLDITLNLMTLGAITVAIGRVIDDSIVVVENIYRRIHLKEEKLTGGKLIREATIEMFRPILSSTIVTVAVFTPLIFVGGLVGELFLPFALTMTFALGASLVVAITIVPALSHFLFKKKLQADKTEIKHQKTGKLANWYRGVLDWTLNHKIITSTIAVLLLAASIALTPLIGFSFLGSEEEKVMYLSYSPGTGELVEDTIKNVEVVEDHLLKRDDIDILQMSISDDDEAAMMMGGGAGSALIYVIFDKDLKNFPEVRGEIEDYLADLNQSGEWSNNDASSMAFSSNEISYTLYSEDLKRLNDAVLMLEDVMKDSKNIEDVTASEDSAYVEHSLKVKQEDLLQYGLTTGQILGFLYADNERELITSLEKDGQNIEVFLAGEEVEEAKSIDELLTREIETVAGMMPLADLVSVEEGRTNSELSRSKGEYYATVSGSIIGDDISKASSEIDKAIEDMELPKGVRTDIGGVAADMDETFTQLGLSMIAAVAIVYFILVVTFGEGVAPFSILFSLPFAVIGSFTGLYLAGETISVSVMMGLLMLIGIIVTNAIVLVDRIVRMERSGMIMREAILEAGVTRLRPILMTAIATIGALIPLAIGADGGGGFISKGLAISVIGGLASSTVLTLIIVPIVYEFLSKLFKKNRKEVIEL